MRKTKYIVKLKPRQQSTLDKLVRRGKHPAAVLNRARILLLSHKGKSRDFIAETLSINPGTITSLRRRFQSEGLQALHDKPRSGQPPKITGRIEAQLVALACSASPAGTEHWTMRMLADKIVELGWVDSISHKTVWEHLKKTT